MKIGYARVSTTDQNPELQIEALKNAGCERFFIDKISGKTLDRPELDKMLSFARAGDIVYVWKLDRLGRSVHHLMKILDILNINEVDLNIITNQIDTTTPHGKLFFTIIGAVAEMEHTLITERTTAGRIQAKKNGVKFGRKSKITKEAITEIKTMQKQGKSLTEISEYFNVSVRTIQRLLSQEKNNALN